MKIHTYGIDQVMINELKDNGFQTITQTNFPDSQVIQSDILIFTSDMTPVAELGSIREKYPDAVLFYQYLVKGVRHYQQLHALCDHLGIHFFSPRATVTTYLDKLRLLMETFEETKGNIIGVFGSGSGVGVTSMAATLAKHISSKGKSVVLLGLNVYDPGWNRRTNASLDQWQPRLTGKILQPSDFNDLEKIDGFRYLPGNFDCLAALDFQEDEIEYLLKTAKEQADVVIADFGSIPESAAWYVGLQWSSIRLFVSQSKHHYRMEKLLQLIELLDIRSEDFFLIMNRANLPGPFSAKAFSQHIGMNLLMEFQQYEPFDDMCLPIGKREHTDLENATRSILRAIGFQDEKTVQTGRKIM